MLVLRVKGLTAMRWEEKDEQLPSMIDKKKKIKKRSQHWHLVHNYSPSEVKVQNRSHKLFPEQGMQPCKSCHSDTCSTFKKSTVTSAHLLCENNLLVDTETLPSPFPFLIFKLPARVSVSVRVRGALRGKQKLFQGCLLF